MRWAAAVGGIVGVIALLGLFVAAGAQDGVFYATGLGLFVFWCCSSSS